ncbi:MAG: ROK family protein [Nitriliruptoraceae bacterium]
MTVPAAVGVDVGGTHLRAAAVGGAGPVPRARARTAAGATLVADLAAAAAAVDPDGGLPLGLGMAGLVTRDGRFVYGPNVGVADLPLADLVAAATGRAVTVLNDATAAALGEHRLGAGAGHDDVLLLTLGTGVGGGIVAGGRLLLGAHGFAAELGHVIVEDGGRDAPSGIPGTRAGSGAGAAVARAAAGAAARGEPGARALDAVGVVAAAGAGEAWAADLLAEAGRWLGVALASLTNALDPGVVVVGGGFGTAAAPWLLPAAEAALAARVLGGPRRPVPPVRVAALGDDAGLLGAALAALDAASAA